MTETFRRAEPQGADRAFGADGTLAARQTTLRRSNLELVLKTVLASPGLSRAGVATATALTRSTVSRLVDELIEAGFLVEGTPSEVQGRGRPGTPLQAGNSLVALGLQINAGYLAARAVSLSGMVLADEVESGDFVGSDPQDTLLRLARLARDVSMRLDPLHQVVGAGFALPGLVAASAKVLLRAPNLGWTNVAFGPFAESFGIPGQALQIGNEADLAARAVATPTPGRPSPLRDFIYVSGEIGIGGAAVLDGRLLTGRHGWGGEIGHVCVDPHGPPCPCGSTGCLEQYAGRRVLLEAAGLAPSATTDDVADAVRGGDRVALAAVNRLSWALGVALASVVNLLDIPHIVLGGHLGAIADLISPGLDQQLRMRVLSAAWVTPRVDVSIADPAAGAMGAALHVFEGVISSPADWLQG